MTIIIWSTNYNSIFYIIIVYLKKLFAIITYIITTNSYIHNINNPTK